MLVKTPEYLVSHGKTGVLGRFLSSINELYVRGDRVVLKGDRGLSLGVVLCQATDRHARFLLGAGLGHVLHRVGPDDEATHAANQDREKLIFESSRAKATHMRLPLEILDCELSLDGRCVILQYLLAENCELGPLVNGLATQFDVEVWLENLAMPVEVEQHGGCGEPNCGRVNGSGGCTTCSSGGGCSSCGSGKVDMRAYFAHLREQMEATGRQPLL